MSVLPAACPIQGIMHQCYHRGIRGNGLRGVKYALAGPHPLSEWAVESWCDRPKLGYTFIIPRKNHLAFTTKKSGFFNENAPKPHVSEDFTTRADSSSDKFFFLKLVGDVFTLKHT